MRTLSGTLKADCLERVGRSPREPEPGSNPGL
jgi:hypothetical protein